MGKFTLPAVAVLASLVGAGYWFLWRVPAVIRVGAQDLPPFIYFDEAGRSFGAMARAMEEAARRAGMQIEWHPGPNQNFEDQLATGKLDLWLSVWTPRKVERATYFTESFLKVDLVLATLGTPLGRQSGGGPRRVAGGPMVAQTDLAAQMFPQAELLMVPAEAFALEALCRGEVDAALVSQISLMMAVVTTAPGVCAGKPLQLTSARRAVFTRTAAAPRFHRAADALIQRFGEVALDGTLDELARGQPGVLPTLVTQAKVVAQESRDRRRQRELIAGLSAIIAALVAMAAYLRTARRRADQAMVQAQAGERAKRDFLAMMSHEIRTPLNGILGMTGLIRDEPDPAVARDYAATAQASAQHLMGLLEGVLDISALEAGAIQLKHRPFDLHELIERAAHAVRSSAKPAVAISTVISPAVPRRASGDPERLMQILLSLLSNAEKFTDQGTVVIGAELVSHPAAGPVVRLSVSDTGIGIPVTLQERIFEKFEQGDQSITRRHGGMGLGLAIARALVQAMGGQIQVASTEGVGTTLAVTLQFAHAPEL